MSSSLHFILYCVALIGLLFLHEFANWQSIDQGRKQRDYYQSILLVVVIIMISDWMAMPLMQLDLVYQLIEHQKSGWNIEGALLNTGRWLLLYLPVFIVLLLSALRFKRQRKLMMGWPGFSKSVITLVMIQVFYYLGLTVEDLQISGWIGKTQLMQEGQSFFGWVESKEQLTAQFVLLTSLLVMVYTLYRRRVSLLRH